MSSPITPIQPTAPTPIGDVLGQGGATTSIGTAEVDQDMFLKLLVAQLKYQDPSNPVDGSAFMAQTAQFTQVEKLNTLVKSQQEILGAQLLVSANALIGRTVSYTPAGGGDPVTGTVSSVSLNGGIPTVRVGGTDVPLPSVKEIRASSTS
jgi:flagellar basal-body rod modification protein FlgD